MGARFENISFSDIVLQNVTGPINFSIGPGAQGNRRTSEGSSTPPVVRNISFSNIHGTVTTDPAQLSETTLTSGYNPGERHSCIALNCVEGSTLENVSFDNVHLIFGGGGTAEDATRRDLPEFAGEYFALGPMPAYGFYARHTRGITLQNIRLQTASPDLRPAVVLDQTEDVSITGLAVQGNPQAESVLRVRDSQHVLLTSPRVLNPSPVFLQVEGEKNANIIVEGGDLSRASSPVSYKNGGSDHAVKLRGI